jgi:hypothetical protein
LIEGHPGPRRQRDVRINRLDGTTLEEKASELPTPDQLLDAIAHVLQEHEAFAASIILSVVPNR